MSRMWTNVNMKASSVISAACDSNSLPNGVSVKIAVFSVLGSWNTGLFAMTCPCTWLTIFLSDTYWCGQLFSVVKWHLHNVISLRIVLVFRIPAYQKTRTAGLIDHIMKVVKIELQIRRPTLQKTRPYLLQCCPKLTLFYVFSF